MPTIYIEATQQASDTSGSRKERVSERAQRVATLFGVVVVLGVSE